MRSQLPQRERISQSVGTRTCCILGLESTGADGGSNGQAVGEKRAASRQLPKILRTKITLKSPHMGQLVSLPPAPSPLPPLKFLVLGASGNFFWNPFKSAIFGVEIACKNNHFCIQFLHLGGQLSTWQSTSSGLCGDMGTLACKSGVGVWHPLQPGGAKCPSHSTTPSPCPHFDTQLAPATCKPTDQTKYGSKACVLALQRYVCLDMIPPDCCTTGP